MRPPRQPYALEPSQFSFAGIAAFAARAPLGGAREIAVAAFVTARLAHDMVSPRQLPLEDRRSRAGGARRWLSNLTIPDAMRRAFLDLVGATESGPTETAAAIRKVMEVTAQSLDVAGRAELDRLARELEAQPIVGT